MLKFILIGILIVAVMFFFDIIYPKLKLKYRLHKELKKAQIRRKKFGNKMKELEIK